MSISDLTKRVENIASAWEQFKLINERRLKEVEQNGYSQSSTREQLQKISDVINDYKQRVDSLELSLQRPEFGDSGLRDKSFEVYVRKGIFDESLMQKGLNIGNEGEGGYLVRSAISKRIHQQLTSLSPMRQLASIEEISTDAIELLIESSSLEVGWRKEADEAKETKTPTLAKVIVYLNELYAQPQITKRLLDDAFLDVESWLINKLVEAFVKAENKAFVSGDGASQPKGILAYKNGSGAGEIEQITSEALDSEAIMSLFYSLNEVYAVNACFLMNRSTLQKIRSLKTSDGHYLWQPSLAMKSPDTILGIPVYQSADMPMSDSVVSPIIAVADFKSAYQIVHSQDIRILRDPFTSKPFVKFYTTKRIGGGLVQGNAIKLLTVKPKTTSLNK